MMISQANFLAGLGQDNPLLLGLLILGFSVAMLLLTRRRFAKQRQQSEGDLPAATRHSPLTGQPRSQEVQQSMRELMLELEQLSREINSQVDTRLRALNLLVQEADEKIKELRRLQGLAEGEGAAPRHLPQPRQEPHPEAASERYAQVYALAEKGRTVVEIARELSLMTGEVELILALRRAPGGRPGDQ